MDIPDSDLLWWFGVLHTDAYIYEREDTIKELRLKVGKNSMKMLMKWNTILDSITEKKHRILKENYLDKRFNKYSISYCTREGSKKILDILVEKLPSKGFRFNAEFAQWLRRKAFGPYLAGIIDGDGCFQVRKSNSYNGYEKLLKISDKDSEKLLVIQKLLLKNHMPKGYITEYDNHSDLWIYINKQFNRWLIAEVLPHMTINRKINNCLGGVVV